MKVAALRTAPPTIIATVAIVGIYRVYRYTLALACVRSHISREYLLVLQILFQGDAARYNDCELAVVHGIGAGVFGKVFFDDLACNPANPSDKAGDGCGVEERLHELVARHGGVYLGVFFALLTAVVPMAVVVAVAGVAAVIIVVFVWR